MSDCSDKKIPALPPLREIIAAHELRAKKSLGQNFLLDSNITDKIARTAGIQGRHVIEVGPGPGGLTRSLLDAGAEKVTVIEVDDRIIPILSEYQSAYGSNHLEIIHADALELDVTALGHDITIVANLPYNIATPLLIHWLKTIYNKPGCLAAMTLMFQREVGQRIIASPGNKHYGRLAILAQWLCNCSRAFDLPPSAFTPPPKVTSSVIQFHPRSFDTAKEPHFETVEKLTSLAFGQRRKMIRSTLAPIRDILQENNIDPTLRAENIAPSTYISLARMIDERNLEL